MNIRAKVTGLRPLCMHLMYIDRYQIHVEKTVPEWYQDVDTLSDVRSSMSCDSFVNTSPPNSAKLSSLVFK